MMNMMRSCSFIHLSKDDYTIDNIGSKCTIRGEENSPTTPKYPQFII
jgi:hypothetical protein